MKLSGDVMNKYDRHMEICKKLKTNPVPFIIVNSDPSYKLAENGCLADIIPTMIDMMGYEKPVEMTGKSLLIK